MTTIKAQSPALVMSGGGMKAAAFHVGVSLALSKLGLKTQADQTGQLAFDQFVGASAGSVIASFFAAGYSPQDVIFAFTQGNHNLNILDLKSLEPSHKLPPLKYRDIFNFPLPKTETFKWLKNFVGQQIKSPAGGVESLLKSFVTIGGFFNTQGLADYFDTHVFPSAGTTFADLEKNLFIVATFLDKPAKAVFCKHPKPKKQTTHQSSEYISKVPIAQAIAASASLPPLFSPTTIDDETFFDGEIRDSLNSHIALDHDADLVIVSYSMQPYEFNEEFGSLSRYGLPVIANQALYQLIQQKIESHMEASDNLGALLNTLDKELAQHLDAETKDKLMHKLEKKFAPARHTKILYIHPSPQDHEMFFADHLSLKPKVLNKIVTIGFKSAMNALRQYKFVG